MSVRLARLAHNQKDTARLRNPLPNFLNQKIMYMGRDESFTMEKIPNYLKIQVAAYALQFPHLRVSSARQVDEDNILVYFKPFNGSNSLIGKTFPYIAEHCFDAAINKKEEFTEENLAISKMFVKL